MRRRAVLVALAGSTGCLSRLSSRTTETDANDCAVPTETIPSGTRRRAPGGPTPIVSVTTTTDTSQRVTLTVTRTETCLTERVVTVAPSGDESVPLMRVLDPKPDVDYRLTARAGSRRNEILWEPAEWNTLSVTVTPTAITFGLSESY